MPFYRSGTRYSRWDGSQSLGDLDASDLMDALSDDLMNSGDLDVAMQRLFRWGFDRPDGEHVPGLRDLMERVRKQQRQERERYDLGSVVDQVREKLRQVMETERNGIAQRLDEGEQRLKSGQRPGDDAAGGEDQRPNSDASGGEPGSPDRQPDSGESGSDGGQQRASSGQRSQSRGASESRKSAPLGGGQDSQAGGGPHSEPGDSDYDPDLHRLLEQMAERKRDQLDRVPDDPAGAIQALRDYEFMVPEAYDQFRELLQMLQQQMMDSTFQGMSESLQNMSSDDIDQLNDMLSDLNDMLEADARGEPTDFEQFKHKWGHYFGNEVENLDQLRRKMAGQMQAMQQLMQNLSPEQQQQLDGMMNAALNNPDTRQQMQRLAQNLGQQMSFDPQRSQLPFTGDESLTLNEAMRLMNRMSDLEDLERKLQDVGDWRELADLDEDMLRELLGEEAGQDATHLHQFAKMLEEAGLIRETRRGYELTPQGVRKIGQKALQDIFLNLKRDRVGQHETHVAGSTGERIDQSKPYEFGDPFMLDLPRTVMNAVQRDGIGSPVQLRPDDFEVYRTEYTTRTATVLMIDMSRSMLYNGCFNAAKKVALALDSLIRSQYPRDAMTIIGFSSVAEELKASDLPTLRWNEHNYGTNMQHGFQLARQFLSRHHGANRQIIVVTDGEPTAHFDETGKVRFNYPPQPRTFRETLKEVGRLTKDGVTINTFMMERSLYMVQFMNDLMKINKGRMFAATPDRLGEYVLVDYVANKRKLVN